MVSPSYSDTIKTKNTDYLLAYNEVYKFYAESLLANTYLFLIQQMHFYSAQKTILARGECFFGCFLYRFKNQGLVIKNLLDEHYKTGAATYSSTNAVTGQAGYGRAFSLAFRATL